MAYPYHAADHQSGCAADMIRSQSRVWYDGEVYHAMGEKVETRNKKQETRGKKQETRGKKQETRGKKRETRYEIRETRYETQDLSCGYRNPPTVPLYKGERRLVASISCSCSGLRHTHPASPPLQRGEERSEGGIKTHSKSLPCQKKVGGCTKDRGDQNTTYGYRNPPAVPLCKGERRLVASRRWEYECNNILTQQAPPLKKGGRAKRRGDQNTYNASLP